MTQTNTFINGLTLKENTKDGLYHSTTLSANLDLFALQGRIMSEEDILTYWNKAYSENKEIAMQNFYNILAIRLGKGERRMAKIIINDLANKGFEDINKLIDNIFELGRIDYAFDLIADNDKVTTETINNIAMRFSQEYENFVNGKPISLMAKWMPSINTSSKSQVAIAKCIVKALNISEREYRKMLSRMRTHLNILEKNMSQKTWENIDYSKIPSQAMLKHTAAFQRNDNDKFTAYKESLFKGENKINAGAVTPTDILYSLINDSKQSEIHNAMWKSQPDISLQGKNVLVVADVSGSMGYLYSLKSPIHTSVSLALYFAERNTGAFKDKFVTFSSSPTLQVIYGQTLTDKFQNISKADWSMTTNIDAVFKLTLNATLNADKKDLPEYILIISDMEFDKAEDRKTNFEFWKFEYAKNGLTLPKIIFWNVAHVTKGFPVMKTTENVAMISGNNPAIAKNLFNLEEFNPVAVMLNTLEKFKKYL